MESENKKVKNAQKHEYNGILFKSKLELDTYKMLISEGFNPEYEKHTYQLQETKLFPTPHYTLYKDRKLHKKVWGLNTYKIRGLRYTPDFVFTIGDTTIIIESKGFCTEKYPYQKKLFFKWLEEHNPNSVFFEVHNIKQLKETVRIIKDLQQ